MLRAGIILVLVGFFAGCHGWQAPPPVGTPVSMTPVYVMPQQQIVMPGPAIAQPVIGPEVIPPPPLAGAPPVVATPIGPPLTPEPTDPFEVPLAEWAPGTAVSPAFGLPPGPDVAGGLPNPLPVPVTNDELAWDQLADVVDDYFQIAGEQRVNRTGEVWTEGHIDTAPQVGATWLEPHRPDSAGEFNRWESTLQSIRRRAAIRVIPNGGGYLVEVAVQKEIEDLPHPEQASASAAAFRSDNALPTRASRSVSRRRLSNRWIPLGRDLATEQKMLADIQARLIGAAGQPIPAVTP